MGDVGLVAKMTEDKIDLVFVHVWNSYKMHHT